MTKVKRLIEYFKPTHYDLTISLNEDENTFSGFVTIDGVVLKEQIILHAKDLTIKKVLVNGKQADWSSNGDELKITPPSARSDDVLVAISFSGQITDAMHGLYPSYFKHDGETKKIFATQFESHHAREMFPCVDEPAAKATFDLTISSQPDVTVLSNQPLKWQRTEDGRLISKFETTPIMSTYLLAVVVGDLIKLSGKTKDGVEVNVYASSAHKPRDLEFALENSIQLIEFYNDYFKIPYPLTKSDQVALPDFSSGAMENWGLITYRESALLISKNSDIDSRQHVAKVIAHELSHQWFGNLVTMQWWNDLWLNESFANMIEYFAVDTIHPDWHIWQDFSSMEIPYALSRDSLDGVQSVRCDVNHPDEISTLFDGAIVYAKGGHLLAMIKNYIGEQAFRDGLTNYFRKYAYKNTVGDNLWDELSQSSGQDVTSLMNRWIDKPGFPVVFATFDGSNVTLTQERFFIGKHKNDETLWPIPLDANSDKVPHLMTEKSISFPKDSQPLLLNQNNHSHFITHYDQELRQDILTAIKNDELSNNFKIQFLNESLLLAQAELLGYSDLIESLVAFSNEKNEQVWNILASVLVTLRKFVISDEQAEKALKQLGYNMANKEYKRLGFSSKDNESENDIKLRSTLMALMLYADDDDVIKQAIDLSQKDLEQIDAEIRPIILANAVKNADTDELFDRLYIIYPKTTDPILRDDILSALTSTKKPKQIKLLLENITNKEFSRPQDLAYWYVRLLRNKYATDIVWDWLQVNWKLLETIFKGDKSYDDYPRLSVAGLHTDKHLIEYNDFFLPLKDDPALSRVISLGSTELEAKVTLINKHQESVKKKLLSL